MRGEGDNQRFINRHTQYLKMGKRGTNNRHRERERAEEILTRQKLEEEWDTRK